MTQLKNCTKQEPDFPLFFSISCIHLQFHWTMQGQIGRLSKPPGGFFTSSIVPVNKVTDFFTRWPSFTLLSLQLKSKQATGIPPRPSKSVAENQNQLTKQTEQNKKMNIMCEK